MTDTEKLVWAQVYARERDNDREDHAANLACEAVHRLRSSNVVPEFRVMLDEVLGVKQRECASCGKPMSDQPPFTNWDMGYCSRHCLKWSLL